MTQQPAKIDASAIADAVSTERLALCDVLETLTPAEWQTPSLCTDWTVHDVVAHLTLATRDTTWDLLKGAVRARGSWNRMTTDMARRHARHHPPEALIQQLRSTAESTRRPPLSSPVDPLVDVLVHTQDITRPIGRAMPTSPVHAIPALTHAVDSRWYGGAKRFAGLTLVATDTDWKAGDGDLEVHGPAGDLLLIATGRPAGLAGVSGTGADTLATRMA